VLRKYMLFVIGLAFALSVASTAYAQEVSRTGEIFRDCPTCPEMVVLPPGEFVMGSPLTEVGRDSDEGPRHQVRLAKSFAVAKYKVTRAEYAAFVKATGHADGAGCWVWGEHFSGRWQADGNKSWRDPGFEQTDQDPVVCVNWDDAKAYAVWLTQKTGKSFRLLTEAESEYAARAGSTSSRPWGEDSRAACRYANVADQTAEAKVQHIGTWIECDDGYANTSPVGVFLPNAFGLYDTIGNAWEWVEDCYHESYEGAPPDGRAWTSGECSEHVARGGSWDNYPRNMRSAFRYRAAPPTRTSSLGFRLGRTLQ